MNYSSLGYDKDMIENIVSSTKALSKERLCLFSKRILRSRKWGWRTGMLLYHDTYPMITVRLGGDPDWDAHVFCGGYPDLSDEQTLCIITKMIQSFRHDDNWAPSSFNLDGYELVWVKNKPSKDRQTYYDSYQEVLIASLCI